MKKYMLAAAVLACLALPAYTQRYCSGMLTSNNVCIGSESNIDSFDNHAPFYTAPPSPHNDSRPQERRVISPQKILTGCDMANPGQTTSSS
jgi:hypothetical protein